MGELTQPYISKLTSLKGSIGSIAKQIVIDNSEKIMNLLRFGQLALGKNSLGSPLAFRQGAQSGTGFYSDATPDYVDIYKKAVGNVAQPKAPGSPYNFQWSGETFAFMDVSVKTSDYEIFSKTSKFNLLKSIYGEEAFELSKEHNDFINNEIIIPELAKHILSNFTNI